MRIGEGTTIGGLSYGDESPEGMKLAINRYFAPLLQRAEADEPALVMDLLRSLAQNTPPIKVHDTGDPIRNVIRRGGGETFVPAVLRNTMVPTKVLVETANLTNAEDRERLADPQWRQWFAEAFVAAVRAHYGS